MSIDIQQTCLARIDTSKIYPQYLELICQALYQCMEKGFVYVATSGFRSYKEQDILYAQGRTAPGQKCTNAKGGQSNHNFGISIDFARDMDPRTPGLQPSWDLKDLQPLLDEAQKVGLECGAYWKSIKDTPHIQLHIGKYGIKFAQLDEIYRKNNNLEDVWKFLDQNSWAY